METLQNDRIREYARREYIEPARRRGEITVRIAARDVHKALALQNRYPAVSSALRARKFLEQNHLELVKMEGPPGGMSSTVTFTYRLLDAGKQPAQPGTDRFLRIYGIGKEVFESLGGGEAFIRGERENFYSDKKEHP